MDDHTEIWLPLGFTDHERRARDNHNLFLIGRLKEAATAASAQTELNALTVTWSARTGITPGGGDARHVFQPPGKGDAPCCSGRHSRTRSLVASADRSGCCRGPSHSCCSSPAPTSRICCSRGPSDVKRVRRADGAWRDAPDIRKPLARERGALPRGWRAGRPARRVGVFARARAPAARFESATGRDPRVCRRPAHRPLCGLWLVPISSSLGRPTMSGKVTCAPARPRPSSPRARRRRNRAGVQSARRRGAAAAHGAQPHRRRCGARNQSELVTFSITLPPTKFDLIGRARALPKAR